jgi:uncharacterized membrane protein YqjE
MDDQKKTRLMLGGSIAAIVVALILLGWQLSRSMRSERVPPQQQNQGIQLMQQLKGPPGGAPQSQ